MFSPYYAWARRGGAQADPRNHCALNVCLYGPRAARWTMTERGRAALHTQADALAIGPSSLRWTGDALEFEIAEVAVPWPRPVRGRVRVQPGGLSRYTAQLESHGRHCWEPIAPQARIEVAFEAPALRWRGEAYVDSNFGSEPLETRLADWHWSRGRLGGETAVLYDVRGDAQTRGVNLAVAFDARGDTRDLPPPPRATLPGSGWRIARSSRSEDGAAQLVASLEDTPFYARSRIRHRLAGEAIESIHESLDLRRFRAPVVQAMLPFRMPRRAAARPPG